MRVLVPFDSQDPKTRLSPALDGHQRQQLATVMLSDVLTALRGAGHSPELLTTSPVDDEFSERLAARDCFERPQFDTLPVIVDERPLTTAVNSVLADATQPIAIVMADLALATPETLQRLFAADADIVIAPGSKGGTNALVIRHRQFRVDYHGVSYCDHRTHAAEIDASIDTVDSFRLSVDIDEPADLVELLIHGNGTAPDWLEQAGFSLTIEDGEPIVSQSGESL